MEKIVVILLKNVNCEMESACKTCLDLISQNKTYFTDVNMLKRKPPDEYHQMLSHYEAVNKPKQITLILNLPERF